jgi:Carbohydrate family 9 binding domain-like
VRINRILARLIALIVMGTVVFVCQAAPAKYSASRVTGRILVDGQLNEPAWRKAQEYSGFSVLSSRTKGAPKAGTSFRVLAGKDAIYIGIRCEEPAMDKLRARPVERDKNVFYEDCVEVFLDPAGKGNSYYQFALTVNNDQWDGGSIEAGNTRMDDYSSVWQSAVHRGKNFWSAEIRIPLTSLFNTRAADFRTVWKLNVARERKAVSELSSWAPLKRGFHEPSSWRLIGNMPLKPASRDLAIIGAEVDTRSADGTGRCSGDVFLKTLASKEAAGDYRFSAWSGDQLLVKGRKVSLRAGANDVLLKNLTFPKQGRVALRFGVDRLDGKPALGVLRSVIISHQDFAFTLDEPFYAACIFADQKVNEIRGTLQVNLPAKILRGGKATLTFTGPGIRRPVTKPLSFKDGRVEFTFDASSLRVGEAKLTAKVTLNGKTIAEGVQVIRKLAPNKGSTVYIDRNLNLVANGRPLFYRGWYGGSQWMVSAVIQKRWPTPKDAFPSADYGVGVGVEPERIDRADKQNTQRDIKPSKKVLDGIRARVSKARNDPKTWWYYLSDEPECRNVSPVYLKYCYDLIKELDPYHPVVIISRAPERFTACSDILSPHPYLNPMVTSKGKRMMKSPKEIRRQIQSVYKAGRGRILPWLTQQAFSYGSQVREADYPTFIESRCMVWTAVANGCKGFHPFIYHAAFDRPGLLHGYRMFYESLAKLEPILISPSSPEPVTVEAPDDGVDVMIKRHDGKTIVIAVNLLNQPVTATVKSPALKGIRKLERFRESGQVTVAGGVLKLKFEPYGVTILTSSTLDKGLDTVDTIQARIAKANAQRKRKGNILYGRGREIEYSASCTYVRMMGLQTTLTDGVRDSIGWRHVLRGEKPAWVEMAFPIFVPRFRKIKIFGNRLGRMDIYAWKRGEWKKLATAPADAKREVTVELKKPMSTVKLRLVLHNSKPGHVDSGELYEIELYK